MRAKLLLVFGVVTVALVIAACGSSSKSSSSSSSSASSASTSSSTPATTSTTPAKKGKKHKAAGIPSRTYSVKLKGSAETPPGAPKGTGAAVVTIHGKTLQACWRFAHLTGFTKPAAAHIHKGAAGTAGNIVVPLSTGPTFEHKGCAPASASVLKGIEANPHGYYVNIHNAKYPGGAVRAQL